MTLCVATFARNTLQHLRIWLLQALLLTASLFCMGYSVFKQNWHTFSHRNEHKHFNSMAKMIENAHTGLLWAHNFFFLHVDIQLKPHVTAAIRGATVSFKMKYRWKIVAFRNTSGSFFVKCYLSLSIIVSETSVCSATFFSRLSYFLTHMQSHNNHKRQQAKQRNKSVCVWIIVNAISQ